MKYLLFSLLICFAVNANGQSLKGIPSDPRLELYTAIFQRAAYSGKGDNCDSVNYWRNRALKAEKKYDSLQKEILDYNFERLFGPRKVNYNAWGNADTPKIIVYRGLAFYCKDIFTDTIKAHRIETRKH